MNVKLISPVMHSPLLQVLYNRGIKDPIAYITAGEEVLNPPTKLDNITEAAKIIIESILKNKRIALQVDCDCDGYTSAALFLNFFHHYAPDFVENSIQYFLHDDKTHGISQEIIDNDFDLIIIPDASSNEVEVHKALAERGAQIVVLDHHLADEISPYACIVNNQLCDYPNKELSGVGIVYKLCELLSNKEGFPNADDYLDLVALGNIADMVDLRSVETKYLINKGLQNIKNPFIKAMREKNAYSIGSTLTPISMAFYVAPFVNAMTRSGTQEEKIMLFESMLEYKANQLIPSNKRGEKGKMVPLVSEAVRVATNVKSRQKRIIDEDAALIETYIEMNNLLSEPILLILLPNLNRNVAGLMCNQYVAKYQRPVMILTDTGEAYEGSCRGFECEALPSFRDFLRAYPHLMYAEGHDNAFGVGIPKDKIEDFIEWYRNSCKGISLVPTWKVDLIYKAGSVDMKQLQDIADNASLWGQNIDEPLIYVTDIPTTKIHLYKGKTLRIDDKYCSYVDFSFDEDKFEELGNADYVNIVGTCGINDWDDSLQFKIKDYELFKSSVFDF